MNSLKFQIGANAAISTGVKECSDIGLQMINKGGNAVDAAVAAMFCMGVVNAESSGLGGWGGFATVNSEYEEHHWIVSKFAMNNLLYLAFWSW